MVTETVQDSDMAIAFTRPIPLDANVHEGALPATVFSNEAAVRLLGDAASA